METIALGQCAECLYTETLDITYTGFVVSNTVFRRGGPTGLVHYPCGGEVRLWTGKDRAYRLRGVR